MSDAPFQFVAGCLKAIPAANAVASHGEPHGHAQAGVEGHSLALTQDATVRGFVGQ